MMIIFVINFLGAIVGILLTVIFFRYFRINNTHEAGYRDSYLNVGNSQRAIVYLSLSAVFALITLVSFFFLIISVMNL